MGYIYIPWKHYFTLKMEEILSCATVRINLEDIMLSEISQSQKYCMIFLICDTSE